MKEVPRGTQAGHGRAPGSADPSVLSEKLLLDLAQ